MATLIINRFDGKKGYEQTYTLAAADVAGKTLLNTLLFIKQTQDPTLNFTASCRCAICGACGVRVNGHAVLACDTKMDDLFKTYGTDSLHIAPLANFRVISDLVVDWEPAVDNLRKIHPGHGRQGPVFRKGGLPSDPGRIRPHQKTVGLHYLRLLRFGMQ